MQKKGRKCTLILTHTKINSKFIKDFNVRHKTIKALEKNTGEKLHGIGFGNGFLDITPKTQATKANIDK